MGDCPGTVRAYQVFFLGDFRLKVSGLGVGIWFSTSGLGLGLRFSTFRV